MRLDKISKTKIKMNSKKRFYIKCTQKTGNSLVYKVGFI